MQERGHRDLAFRVQIIADHFLRGEVAEWVGRFTSYKPSKNWNHVGRQLDGTFNTWDHVQIDENRWVSQKTSHSATTAGMIRSIRAHIRHTGGGFRKPVKGAIEEIHIDLHSRSPISDYQLAQLRRWGMSQFNIQVRFYRGRV
jgi:hypothetical protein